MAEIFGIIAGAAGIAPLVFGLAGSVEKLKEFCYDIEKAMQQI